MKRFAIMAIGLLAVALLGYAETITVPFFGDSYGVAQVSGDTDTKTTTLTVSNIVASGGSAGPVAATTLTASGATTLSGTATVNNNITGSSNLTVRSATVGGTAGIGTLNVVTNLTALDSYAGTVSGGEASITTNLTVGGTATALDSYAGTASGGEGSITTNLTVGGTATALDSYAGTATAGEIVVTTNATVSGNVTLGDTSNDVIIASIITRASDGGDLTGIASGQIFSSNGVLRIKP